MPNIFGGSDDYHFEIDKAIQVADGSDVTIIATGLIVHEALKARHFLEDVGIYARVLNMHTIKPIDEEAIIAAAQATGGIVTAEEHSVISGLGDAVAGVTANFCPVKVIKVGIQDCFGTSGKPYDLLKQFGLTSANIVAAVNSLMKISN